MTNPDNIVRVRARNGGRASVYEANGWCQAYGSGILEGTGVVQNTVANMTVLVGGSSSKPDVLIAQNPAGYKIALDIVGQQPVTITAPASNSRISAIVAYTDDLALESTEDTVTGSPASCGLIVVNGSSSASPSAPTDTQIRNAITSDGATGSQASYAIIATIKVASNTTSITDALITRNQAGVQSSKIDWATFTMPTSSVTRLAFGYGYNVDLFRVGNIVALSSWNAFSSNIASGQSLSEKVPLGYRPVNTTTPSKFFADGSTRWVAWRIQNDGSMVIYGDARTGDAVLSYAVWPTNDPFPAE